MDYVPARQYLIVNREGYSRNAYPANFIVQLKAVGRATDKTLSAGDLNMYAHDAWEQVKDIPVGEGVEVTLKNGHIVEVKRTS